MFTGLVEEKGTVVALDDLGDSVRITIRGPLVTSDAKHGDSIAVNGCCLTVVDPTQDTFSADVMRESLVRTSLGDLTPGAEVNLERAMAAGARMGGHIVQGHVDGTATLLDRTPSEHWEVVRFSLPPELARYVVDKGSITVDGVSLTVVEAGERSFTVSLIPETLARTTLGVRQVGDRVNLEADVIAKHVEKLLAGHLPAGRTTPASTDQEA